MIRWAQCPKLHHVPYLPQLSPSGTETLQGEGTTVQARRERKDGMVGPPQAEAQLKQTCKSWPLGHPVVKQVQKINCHICDYVAHHCMLRRWKEIYNCAQGLAYVVLLLVGLHMYACTDAKMHSCRVWDCFVAHLSCACVSHVAVHCCICSFLP